MLCTSIKIIIIIITIIITGQTVKILIGDIQSCVTLSQVSLQLVLSGASVNEFIAVSPISWNEINPYSMYLYFAYYSYGSHVIFIFFIPQIAFAYLSNAWPGSNDGNALMTTTYPFATITDGPIAGSEMPPGHLWQLELSLLNEDTGTPAAGWLGQSNSWQPGTPLLLVCRVW
jgi:hypothetical protein